MIDCIMVFNNESDPPSERWSQNTQLAIFGVAWYGGDGDYVETE
jgi:hypothetical protein